MIYTLTRSKKMVTPLLHLVWIVALNCVSLNGLHTNSSRSVTKSSSWVNLPSFLDLSRPVAVEQNFIGDSDTDLPAIETTQSINTHEDVSGSLEPENSGSTDEMDVSINKQHISESIRAQSRPIICNQARGFNLTEAVGKGSQFQVDFCPKTCNQSKVSLKGSLNTSPLCASCNCDAKCTDYEDCCDLTMIIGKASDITSTASVAQNRHVCFQTRKDSAEYIIATCPDNLEERSTAAEEETYINLLPRDVPTQNISQESFQTLSIVSECNACLSQPESISLVTSNFSGLTYCNHHCLACNEGLSIKSQSALAWRRRKYCTALQHSMPKAIPTDNRNGSHSETLGQAVSRPMVNEDVSITEECNFEYHRPDGVSTRGCDILLTYDVINYCDFNATSSKFDDVSADIYRELEALCGAYFSPVYADDDNVYRNIFCYICQGNTPQEHKSEILHTERESGEPIFTFTLVRLTDLSDRADHDGYAHDDDRGGNDGGDSDADDGVDDDGTSVVDKDRKGNCGAGYWEDPTTGECLQVHCVAGRNVSHNATTAYEYCQLQGKEETSNDLYVLNLKWYVSEMDQTGDQESEDGEEELTPSSTETYKEDINDNVPLGQTQNTFIQNRVICDSSKHSNNIASDEKQGVFKMSEKRPESVPPEYYPELNYRVLPKETPGSGVPITRNSKSKNSKGELKESVKEVDKVRLTYETLSEVMKEYVGSRLETINVTDYVLQVYDSRRDTSSGSAKKDVTADSRDTRMLSPLSIPVPSIGGVLYVVSNTGQNRKSFEEDLLSNFVGLKKLTVDNVTLMMQLTLPSPATLSVDRSGLFYMKSPVTQECCENLEPNHFMIQQFFCDADYQETIQLDITTPCPHVVFNLSDFNVSERSELVRKDLGISLQRHQYLLDDQILYVCVKTLETLLHKRSSRLISVSLLERIESILTLVTLPLSLICLVLSFVTYCVFPMLRSLPGKNNMIMIGWLFVAQLLVLLDPLPEKHGIACILMGIFLHYFWLSTFAWTSVCSFHMFHVFVVRRAASTSSKSHTFYLVRYLLASNIPSILVVFSVIFVNLYISDGETSGYGGRVCYLNSTLLVGVAFILPLSIVLLANFIFFSLTLYTIANIEDVRRHAGRERRNVHIYFRLSSLTGLCWVLALLAEIPGLQPLRSISVLVNGCQGVALFLSYVCNRRVARMWCHLLKAKGVGLGQRSSDSSKQPTLSSSV